MKSYFAVLLLAIAAAVMMAADSHAAPDLVPEAEFKARAAEDETKYTCCCCCGWCLSCSRDANATTSYNPTLKDIFSGYAVKMIPEAEAKDSKYTCCCCCGWCLSCSRSSE